VGEIELQFGLRLVIRSEKELERAKLRQPGLQNGAQSGEPLGVTVHLEPVPLRHESLQNGVEETAWLTELSGKGGRDLVTHEPPVSISVGFGAVKAGTAPILGTYPVARDARKIRPR
jgi:hypothetical protein